MADARPVRCDLLPQRGDLLRQGHTAGAVRALCQYPETGRLAVHWPLRKPVSRVGPVSSSGPDHIPENPMTALALADTPFSRHPGIRGQEMRIRVNPGGHYVTSGNELLVTVLGSCVAACIRDPVAGVGGMNHFMLPESDSGKWGIASASMRFGNFAMEQLINDIL